jgi:hypothetical protein
VTQRPSTEAELDALAGRVEAWLEVQLYEYLLRQNAKLFGAAFGIGIEDAVFLTGQIGNDAIDDDELDRVLGSLYVWVERFFPTAIRIGFASRFAL